MFHVLCVSLKDFVKRCIFLIHCVYTLGDAVPVVGDLSLDLAAFKFCVADDLAGVLAGVCFYFLADFLLL